MKASQINASRERWETASGAAVELGEDLGTGRHVLEIGGVPVATGADYRKMAGLYEFAIAAAPAVITAIIDQVTTGTDDRCATCHRDAHRPGRLLGDGGRLTHGHPYTAPAISIPVELS